MPLFWQHLQRRLSSSRVAAERTTELTASGSTFLPMFGIGIVWSGARGTAELDASAGEWPAWKGGGLTKLRHQLCGRTALMRQAGGEMLRPHPVCAAASSPDDLGVLIRATKRTVKTADLLAATSKWDAARLTGAEKAYGDATVTVAAPTASVPDPQLV